MVEFFQELINDTGVRVLIVVIVLDIIFGILRAIKEKSLNSTIGIDGSIRKVGMLICIFFLSIIDNIVALNFIGFLPDEVKQFIHIEKIGIADLFNILFIVFEALSILKNMILCKLPIPKKFQEFLERIMKEFTGEIKLKEGDKNGNN